MEAMSFVTEDRKTAQESTFPNTHTFDLFGGVDVSLTLMLCARWARTLKVVTTEEPGTCGAPCTVLAHSIDSKNIVFCFSKAACGDLDEAYINYAEEKTQKLVSHL